MYFPHIKNFVNDNYLLGLNKEVVYLLLISKPETHFTEFINNPFFTSLNLDHKLISNLKRLSHTFESLLGHVNPRIVGDSKRFSDVKIILSLRIDLLLRVSS